MTTAHGREAAFRLVDTLTTENLEPPSGIVCTNDQLAVGVIRGLAERGITVPTQVAVVGYGDLAIAADAPIPLTTIEQPKNLLGRSAVTLLLNEIKEGAAHEHVTSVYRPALVVRDSAP
jgi:LacI family transcriptional regulator